MKKYNVTVGFHHNNPRCPWHTTVKARSVYDAIVQAYVQVIKDEFGLIASPDDLRQVSFKRGEATIQCEDTDCEGEFTPVTVWNLKDGKDNNRGCGVGSSVKDTNKYENAWITVEEQKPTVKATAKAIRGHLDKLEQMKLEDLRGFLKKLEAIDG